MNVSDAFLQSYEVGLKQSTSNSWSGIKRDALMYAEEQVPEAAGSVDAWKKLLSEGRPAASSEELLAVGIVSQMSAVATRYRRSLKRAHVNNSVKEFPPTPSPTTKAYALINGGGKRSSMRDQSRPSIHALYEAWCAENDTVSSDGELAHFTGYSSAIFGNVRNQLKDAGWEFSKINNRRWHVDRRISPDEKVTIPDPTSNTATSSDPDAALVAKIVALLRSK